MVQGAMCQTALCEGQSSRAMPTAGHHLCCCTAHGLVLSAGGRRGAEAEQEGWPAAHHGEE